MAPAAPPPYAATATTAETPDESGTGSSVKDTALIVAKNIGVALLFLGALFLLLKLGLNVYTNHGESMEIPTFEGMLIEEAREVADDKGLNIDVTVGAYVPEKEPGLVVQQQPPVGSQVKNNRTVYLTVLSEVVPEVTLPGLVGSYRYDQYTRQLGPMNLKARVKERKFDARQEDGTILYLYYDGQKITDEDLREGVKVPMGSTIDFVVTERKGSEVTLGDYRCQQYGTAEFAIEGSQLRVGRVTGEYTDRYSAYIVSTNPAPGAAMETGQRVNLVVSDVLPADCE